MSVMAGQSSRHFAWINTHVYVVRLCNGDTPCSPRGTYWGLRRSWGSECLVFYDTSAGNRMSFHLREKYKKCDISKFTRYTQDTEQSQGDPWQCEHNVSRGEQHTASTAFRLQWRRYWRFPQRSGTVWRLKRQAPSYFETSVTTGPAISQYHTPEDIKPYIMTVCNTEGLAIKMADKA